MNIATLQMAAKVQNMATQQSTTSSNQVQSQSFSNTLHNVSKPDTAVSDNTMQDSTAKGHKGVSLGLGLNALLNQTNANDAPEEIDVASILNATSLEELSVTIDPTQLLNGQVTVEDLAKALDVNVETLLSSLSELTGQDVEATNVFDVLETIDANLFGFMQNLAQSLEGKGMLSKANAADVAKFLKVVEMVLPKTDLMLSEEMQLSQLKNMMATVASTVVETTQTQQQAAKGLQTVPTVPTVQVSATEQPETVQPAVTTSTSASTTSVAISLPKGTPASQAENFVKQFQQIMNRSQMSNNLHGQKLLIKIYPEHLGSVRIEFTQQDGVMTAKILTSTAAGKQMIESQLHQLKSGFASQNIQMDRIDVSQAITEPAKSEKEQQFNQHTSQQKRDEEKDSDDTDENVSFEELLAELEV